MLTAMTLAVPRRTNIPKSYGEMTKRHLMRTPFILLVGQLFPDGGSKRVGYFSIGRASALAFTDAGRSILTLYVNGENRWGSSESFYDSSMICV